ncbi:MAG: hypothetical protein PHS33_08775 [Candidatus Omnitrophica bacterium]|nr:hypothetical protein [Candidatus Omnitrophota bacterium]MDD5219825.1 hypothetical protein [Candidatus Bipolaricaulis sp.]
MKKERMVKQRIDNGYFPSYQTKKGKKLLWIDNNQYDDYSSATHSHILIDAFNRFWGYSDSPKIEKI